MLVDTSKTRTTSAPEAAVMVDSCSVVSTLRVTRNSFSLSVPVMSLLMITYPLGSWIVFVDVAVSVPA